MTEAVQPIVLRVLALTLQLVNTVLAIADTRLN